MKKIKFRNNPKSNDTVAFGIRTIVQKRYKPSDKIRKTYHKRHPQQDMRSELDDTSKSRVYSKQRKTTSIE